MKILVDTHIFIWASDASELLPNFAKKYLSDPNNRLIISAASLWEMQIKLAIGKLPLRLPLAEMVSQQQQQNGFQILPILSADPVFARYNINHLV